MTPCTLLIQIQGNLSSAEKYFTWMLWSPDDPFSKSYIKQNFPVT